MQVVSVLVLNLVFFSNSLAMKQIFFCIYFLMMIKIVNAQNSIGIFENQFNVGDTKNGSATYNAQTQEYTIEG